MRERKYWHVVFRLILTAAVWISIWQIPALAEEPGFSYTLNEDGTAMITDCEASGDIMIPSRIDGHTVTSLKEKLFYSRTDVTSVTIPATITGLGIWDYVFSYCRNLKEIRVEEGNSALCSVDGVLFSKDKTILYNYPCGRTESVYHVPKETRTLCCTSFASTNLKKLYLDSSDTTWYTYTFFNTGNMTVYYIPGSYSESKVNADIAGNRSFEGDSSYPKFRTLSEDIDETDETGETDMTDETQPDAGQGKETETDAGEGKETETDSGQGKETETDAGQGKETEAEDSAGRTDETETGAGNNGVTKPDHGSSDVTGSDQGQMEETWPGPAFWEKDQSIRLKKVAMPKIKSKSKRKLTVKWKREANASGYQIQYALNKKFTKGKKTKRIFGYKEAGITLKKLKSGAVYYVRIRAFKKANGVMHYGAWSKTRKARVK